MKKTLLFLFVALFALAASAADIVKGGQFIDYILPLQGSNLTSTYSDGTTIWGPKVTPRLIDNGIEDSIRSYWGGNALPGDDGQYHLFVAGWPENSAKGHMTWTSGSMCYHATAPNQWGPFVYKETLGSGHNTEAYKVGDKYVVYNIGNRYVGESINGPWVKGTFNFDLRQRRMIRGTDPSVSLSNMTFTQRQDGSVLAMDRGGSIWVGDGIDSLHQVTGTSAYSFGRAGHEGTLEDPVIWHDDMQYFMIVNDYSAKYAYLFRSLDGITWLMEPGAAYRVGVVYHYNTANELEEEPWYKLERPKVQVDDLGRIHHIQFAAIDDTKELDLANDNHSSKNIILPVVTPRILEVVETSPTPSQGGENPSEVSEITTATTTIKVRVKAEDGFDPQTTLNGQALTLGSYDKVAYGTGFTATAWTNDGSDLIITFTGSNTSNACFSDDDFAPKMTGTDKDGNLVWGYAKLPYINYRPSVLSALIPSVGEDNKINKVTVENFGLGDAAATDVKVYANDGTTLLATGTLPSLAAYNEGSAKQHVALTGTQAVPESMLTTQNATIQIAFVRDGVEINRNKIHVDTIYYAHKDLVTTIAHAEELSADESYSSGKDALNAAITAAKAVQGRFDSDILKQANATLNNALRTFNSENSVSREVYDFYTCAINDGELVATTTTVDVDDNGTTAKPTIMDYVSDGTNKRHFNGRFAMQFGVGSWLWLRNNNVGNDNTGLFSSRGSGAILSIRNLNPGDRVTLDMPTAKHPLTFVSTNAYLSTDDTQTAVTYGANYNQGETYVVTGEAGTKVNLDLKAVSYCCITKITIDTSDPETFITAPLISSEKVDASTQKVTITPAECSTGDAPEATYYTLDGSEPTMSSTLYTEPFTVSATTTVRARSYMSSTLYSDIATDDVFIGMYSTTYDFYNWSLADEKTTYTTGKTMTAKDGSSDVTLNIVDSWGTETTKHSADGHFAVQNTSNQYLRNHGTGNSNTGYFWQNDNKYMAFTHLKANDRITLKITSTPASLISENVYLVGDVSRTLLTNGTSIPVGTTTYAVPADAGNDVTVLIKGAHYTTINNLVLLTSQDKRTITASNHLSTFSANYNSVVPDGVTVYYATAVNGTTVTLKKADTNVIPANTGVLLYNPNITTDTEYEMVYTEDASTCTFDGNLLKPTNAATVIPASDATTTYYGLKPGTLNFGRVASASTPGANKAYLAVPVSQGSAKQTLSFSFEDISTAVNSVNAFGDGQNAEQSTVNNGGLYNLIGQAVPSTTKGIIINNNKKYIQK